MVVEPHLKITLIKARNETGEAVSFSIAFSHNLPPNVFYKLFVKKKERKIKWRKETNIQLKVCSIYSLIIIFLFYKIEKLLIIGFFFFFVNYRAK